MQMKIAIISLIVTLSCGSAHAEKLTIFGVDRTEGYTVMTQTAIAIASGVVATAHPGDEIVVRWISGQSYRPDQVITHLKMPIDKLATVKAGYSLKVKKQQQKYKRKVLSLKKKMIRTLYSLCVGATKRTDIFGFVLAAAEQFSLVPPEAEKTLIMATDLGDNHHYETDIDLQGARVLIYLLNSPANPVKVKVLRDRWKGLFKKWGASDTEFRWPSPRQIHWRNKQCTR